MYCFRVFGLLTCACMLDLRVVVYAVAFVCCHVAFHITRVLRLHVCFAFVRSVCLLAIVCLFFSV